MKVAISTNNNQVSAHFGRCPLFTTIDIEDGKVIKQETIENSGHEPGLIPKFLNEKDVQYIIGVQGTIGDVIKKMQDGTLEGGESLCKPGGGKGYGLDKTECDHPYEENDCEHDGGEK